MFYETEIRVAKPDIINLLESYMSDREPWRVVFPYYCRCTCCQLAVDTETTWQKSDMLQVPYLFACCVQKMVLLATISLTSDYLQATVSKVPYFM